MIMLSDRGAFMLAMLKMMMRVQQMQQGIYRGKKE